MTDPTVTALYDRIKDDIAAFIPDESTSTTFHNHGVRLAFPMLLGHFLWANS